MQFTEECDLKILNLDPSCSGEITWQQGKKKSAIDFVLCNNNLYPFFKQMHIDEDQEYLNLSDHNLIRTNFKYKSIKQFSKKTKIITYNSKSENNIKNYCEEVVNSLPLVNNAKDLNNIILSAEQNHLKKTFIKKLYKDGETDPPWTNNTIKKEIAIQRNLKKDAHKENNLSLRAVKKEKLFIQKRKVKKLIQTARDKYETDLTNGILSDTNRSKKLYTHIKALQNQEFIPEKPIILYDSDGEEIENDLIEERIHETWAPIYQQHANKILSLWTNAAKLNYLQKFNTPQDALGTFICGINIESGVFKPNEVQINIDSRIAEHYEYAMKVERPINKMKNPVITEKEVQNQIKKLKSGKSPGPDNVKPDLYKFLENYIPIITTITKLYNDILEQENFPDEWSLSKTILIKKIPKPTPIDLRPIALTDISYKILMGILKDKISEHIKNADLINDCQTGATNNRRVTENIHILQYLIQKTYINKKTLYIFSIDCTKAFDSVDRYSLLNILLEFNIHPKLVNFIAKTYSNDRTDLYLNNNLITNIEITSGIRQGCNLSALLFFLLTYKIIEMIDKMNIGYKDNNIKIGSLFYMDDGLIFTENIHDLKRLINGLALNCFKYGLRLHHDKCKIMIINDKNINIEKICDINVVSHIKYLGLIIDNDRKCFKTQKKKIFKQGTRLSNQIFSVLGNCSNKMLIGKTFWKGLALPSLLYGSETIPFNKGEIEKLQKFDNKSF